MSTEWLAAELGSLNLVVLDCSIWLEPTATGLDSVSGRSKWVTEHIATSGFADLNVDLADTSKQHRYALPAPQEFADAMAKLGVGDDARVVLYDDNGSVWAARVWWMLRWIGFDNAAILNGGMAAWRAEGRPTTNEVTEPEVTHLTAHPRPETVADRAEVLAATTNNAVCLIDALPEPLYKGVVAPFGRPGHIPSASNTPAEGLINSETGLFFPDETLRPMFPDDSTARTITYCGGGIAASADAYTMIRLGFADVAVYTASLEEWMADPDSPFTMEEV